MDEKLTVKKVAQSAGVGIQTVRFYEREGLIEEPPRTDSGYRLYTPEAAARIRFIKRAQALGFSLPEIRELLALRLEKKGKREEIRKKTRRKIADIDEKIRTLERIKSTLEHITASCKGDGPLSTCPILKAFEDEDCCRGKGRSHGT